MRGFIAEYYNWTSHGEDIVQYYFEAPSVPQVSEEPTPTGHTEAGEFFASSHERVPDDGTRSCPMDTGTSSYVYNDGGPYNYNGSGLADRFSSVVHAAVQPLWDGCNQSQLGVVAGTKKFVKDLGLPVEKIHACKNGCMLYWRDDVDLEYCRFCGDARYKPTRRRDPYQKKSPYAVFRQRRGRCIIHPMSRRGSILTGCILDFAEEPRNVRLALWTDSFVPYGQYSGIYSCWPVIITPYNLSLGMCMSFEYMFLTMVIAGPSNQNRLIDVHLEPLIEELFQLWHVGVRTYGLATNRAFMMQAALMWTMNDLPVYGMASRNKKVFMKNRVKNKVARLRLTGDQILDQVANISPAIEMPFLLPDGYGSDHKWKKKSIFVYVSIFNYPGRASGAMKKR
ncbi:UNVERIFIED_CONTAM: hypothetical protein Sangu_3083400 [Sesamum angustifolium]|uniref:Transposase n=1 Tax=Sesamum angustifolium TaxID=2727405 RepID=A0AAW2K9G2_9LAMI